MSVKTLANRYPLTGLLSWILSVQYFIVQLIAGFNWPHPYSLADNTISDLGNTSCSMYGSRYVCSPLHSYMNASFITLGILMMAGAILIYKRLKSSRPVMVGFGCMFLAGLGTLMVGLFPENTISYLHITGAFMPFLIGNIGIVILGYKLELSIIMRIYTLLSGVIALDALVLFVNHTYLGIGIGGMERIVAYPQTLWLIIFGLYLLKSKLVRN